MSYLVVEARGILTVTPRLSWTSKGYRYREIPTSKRTAAAVKMLVTAREAGRRDRRQDGLKEVQRVRKTAGLPELSMLDPGRAWASAGHADVQTTERDMRVFLTRTSGHRCLPR